MIKLDDFQLKNIRPLRHLGVENNSQEVGLKLVLREEGNVIFRIPKGTLGLGSHCQYFCHHRGIFFVCIYKVL